jgi:hypothetical protein
MLTTTMVVMEPGSDWPGQIGDSMNVVAGHKGDDLLRRAQEKLGALWRNETRVRVAVLACNSATDRGAAVRRAQVAHTLLDAVSHSSFGRLILGASERASHPLRQELLALAHALTVGLGGSTPRVSLLCGDRSAAEEVGALDYRGARKVARAFERVSGPSRLLPSG